MSLTDGLLLGDVMEDLKDGELPFPVVKAFISRDCKSGDSGPTYQTYTFYTIGDVRKAMTDSGQVRRFMTQLVDSVMTKSRWYKIQSYTWLDDDRVGTSVGSRSIHMSDAIIVAIGTFLGGMYIGFKVLRKG